MSSSVLWAIEKATFMIQTECECGRVIKTVDENAGKKAKCPDCGEVVRLPAKKQKQASRSAEPASPSRSARSKALGSKSSKDKPSKRSGGDQTSTDDWGDEEFSETVRSLPSRTRRKIKSTKGEGTEPGSDKAKESKKGTKEGGNSAIMIVLGVGAVVAVGICLGAFLMVKPGGADGAAKKGGGIKLVEFKSEQGELNCLYPEGWEVTAGGGTGGIPPSAVFEKSGAKVSFRSSPSGSALSMIVQPNASDGAEISDDLKPVSRIHEMQKRKVEDDLNGYQETGPAQMIKTAGFGEARVSEFTASERFSKIYGYRVTILGNQNQWIVVCKCSASQWKGYKSMFRKMIESAKGS